MLLVKYVPGPQSKPIQCSSVREEIKLLFQTGTYTIVDIRTICKYVTNSTNIKKY